MAQTLPTQVQKESNLKGYSPRFGIEIAGFTTPEYCSPFKSFTTDAHTYTGKLQSAPRINISTKRLGGYGKVGGFDLTFLNQELYSNMFTVDTNVENEPVIAKLFFDDGTAILDAESIQIFEGLIADIDIDYDKLVFRVEPNDLIKDKKIGTLVDSANYPDAPAESLGAMIPIVYGDHLFEGMKTTVPGDATLNYINNMVKGVLVSTNKYLIANSTVNEINTDDIWLFDIQTKRFLNLDSSHVTVSNPDGDGYCSVTLAITGEMILYDWWLPDDADNVVGNDHDWSNPGNAGDKDITTFATLNATFTTAATADQGYLRVTFPKYDMDGFDYISDIEVFYRGQYTLNGGDDADLTYKIAGSGIDAAAPLNIKGITTSAAINDAGSSALQSTKHGMELQDGDGGDTYKLNYEGSETANISEVALAGAIEAAIEGLAEFNDVTIIGDAAAYWVEYEGTSIGKRIEIPEMIDKTDSLSGTVSFTRDGKEATKDMVSDWLELRVYQGVSAKTPAITCQAHEVYKKIKLVFATPYHFDHKRFVLYAACKGREYGTWINGRAVAEGYTETHVDDDGAGNLIENAAGVIESLYKDEIGFAADDTELNEDSFNIASNDLSTTKLSFTIAEQISGFGLIDDILRTVFSSVYTDYDNKVKMRTFVSGDPFTISGDSVPNNKDIFDFDPQSTFKIETGVNDKLDFDEGGGELTATLDAGEYTGTTLASEINSELLSAGADTYIVSYSTTTGKFSITNTTGTMAFLWSSGTNSPTSCGRFIGFDISADDAAAAAHTSDYPLWDDSFVEHPITKDNFRLRKTDKIVTDLTVEYYLSYQSGKYQATDTATDATYHAETITETVQHPYTNDSTTAGLYTDFLVKNDGTGRWCRKYYENTFRTWLNAVMIENCDIINIRHPVLNGIFTTEKTKKWRVLDMAIIQSSCEIEIKAEEI